MRVAVSGLNDFLKDINNQSKKYKQAVDDGVFLTANQIMLEAVDSISEQTRKPDGSFKRKGKGGEKHYPSPEGGAPNTEDGGLVSSIKVNHIDGSFTATVSSNLDYAAYLEFVMNRPWLQPATEGKEKVLKKNILDGMNKI